jgi:hypothetical protein
MTPTPSSAGMRWIAPMNQHLAEQAGGPETTLSAWAEGDENP